MTDDRPERPLSPEDEERVRRRLAAAGTEPMPPSVADRLDAVLEGLVAERATLPDGADTGVAVPRRRRWPVALVAAAAVSVVALGVGTLTRGPSGGDAASSSAGGQVASAPEGTPGSSSPAPAPEQAGAPGPLPALHTATLRRDVRAVAASLGPGGARSDLRTLERAAGAACPAPHRPAGGQVLPVTLDGRPATLTLDPARDGTRVARVHSCADPAVVEATVRVPAG